jgi:thiol-disulfide isomerase/thioredoxin
VKPRKQLNVSVSPPGIGEEELSFSSVMNFDVLVDSLSDEADFGEAACRGFANKSVLFGAAEICSSGVVKLLQKQNRCKRYISTVTSSQRKVQDDGIIWGRSKAIQFGKDVVEKVSNSRILCSSSSIAPPKKFGEKTLQPLLNAGIVYKSNSKEEVFAQGWNLQDYWEQVSWPRDADGGNTRFGFPVVADLDSLGEEQETEVEGRMISTPPNLAPDAQVPKILRDEFAGKENPYVLDIKGLKDLNHEILSPKKDCIIFLSATYCRTCRYLAPQYTKLARKYADAGNDITFAKSNASGKKGKDVSRALGVDAVPAFCFFKAGKRYGSVVSVSRMPSKKLDAALNLLLSGADWDKSMINSLK